MASWQTFFDCPVTTVQEVLSFKGLPEEVISRIIKMTLTRRRIIEFPKHLGMEPLILYNEYTPPRKEVQQVIGRIIRPLQSKIYKDEKKM